jgi:hypothetical protein
MSSLSNQGTFQASGLDYRGDLRSRQAPGRVNQT